MLFTAGQSVEITITSVFSDCPHTTWMLADSPFWNLFELHLERRPNATSNRLFLFSVRRTGILDFGKIMLFR